MRPLRREEKAFSGRSKVFEIQREQREEELDEEDRNVRSNARSTIEKNNAKTKSEDNTSKGPDQKKKEPTTPAITTVDDQEQYPGE